MRALFDTCVIIDALQNRMPFSMDAQKLFLLIANNALDAYLTVKSLADIHYITKHHLHSETATRKVLSDLLCLFQLLDTTATDCHLAIPSPTSDFEDAIMIETAVRSEMDCIITRNQADYTHSPIKIYTPPTVLHILADPTHI